jgi:hypothetical protein
LTTPARGSKADIAAASGRGLGFVPNSAISDEFDQPIPVCRIVAVTRPPTLDLAFIVNLIAATGVVNAA